MNKQSPLVSTLTIALFSVIQILPANALGNSYATTLNNNGRLSGTFSDGQVPAQATTQEAVAAASLPSSSVIRATTQAYQNGKPSSSRVFGSQLFRGAFATTAGSTFNDSYVINAGDNVQVRMWGAYQFAATMTVDPQGNIFLPNVGPVKIAGVTNGNLQSVVKSAVSRIYRSNVDVYASLEEAQPVKVFVTGFVNQPGYYGGLAADSVLSYIDRAGGVDPERGSYIDIQVLRNGQVVQQVNLYQFLYYGRLQPFAFRDGDVINVTPQRKTLSVTGSVRNDYTFEFDGSMTVGEALTLAQPAADATNVSVTRSAFSSGRAQSTEYYDLRDAKAMQAVVNNGDSLVVTSDRYASTIAVQVKGAHTGNGAVILPYGATLADLVPLLQPSELANLSDLSIYRDSVAQQQKQMINQSLDRLEEMTLATQSVTREEAQLRQNDAELIKQFIAKARKVETNGRLVVVENSWQDVILQQGDVIEIPEKTSVITVNGQVRTQGALTFNDDLTVGDYVAKSGGFTDNADEKEILVVHQNGENQVVNTAYRLQQGDSIMVLPKVKSKNVEIARGVTQMIYQLAVATGVILKF